MWSNNLFNNLFNQEKFRNAYYSKFKQFKEEIYPKLIEYIDTYGFILEPSAKLNAQIWDTEVDYKEWTYVVTSYETKKLLTGLKEWINKRVEYLESRVNEGKF